jgi:type I restriction enzyme M protein
MAKTAKTLLENNLRNAYAYNDQNAEDFGFSVLIQFIKNYLKNRKGLLPQFESLLTDLDFVRNFEVKNIEESNIFRDVDFIEMPFESFQEICNFLINHIISLPTYQNSYTPEYLNKFIVGLLQPRPNQIIYNPVCGIGSTFVTLHKKFPDYKFIFVGQEINPATQFLCKLNLTLEWIPNGDIYWSNSLSHPVLEGKGKVDIAIAVLPLGIDLNQENLSTAIFENPQDIPNTEYAFVELILNMLNKKGRAIIIVPDSFLFGKAGKAYRKKYIEQEIIESVVTFPVELLIYHKTKSSILVLNKDENRDLKNAIQFGKFTKELTFNTVSIDKEEIKEFNLSVNHYAHEGRQEFQNILKNNDKKQIFTVNQVATIVRGKPYTKDKVNSQASDSVPYVGVRDLAANSVLNLEKIVRKVIADSQTKLVDFSAILVNLLGTNLKPTYFDYQGQAIITSSDILALRLKEGFDKDFILLQLQSRLVQIQAEMFVTGDIVERIAVEDFKNIQLIIPSPQEQERQIIEMRGLLAEKNKARIEIAAAKEEIKITEYDVIATIAHNLNQKLGAIRDDYDGLISFLYRTEKEKKLLNFAESLRPLRVGEEFAKADALEDVTKRISEILLDASQTLKTTEDILQKDRVDLQEVDFVEFLETEKKKYANEKFEIEVQTRLKSLLVFIDTNAIKDALRNLIINAEKHGFVKNDTKYILVFELTTISNEDGEYLRLVCKNNGKPFPKGFTFAEYIRLGGRSGKSKGTGIGGFFIKKVVDLHKGNFNYLAIENPTEVFQVQFEILLPLS